VVKGVQFVNLKDAGDPVELAAFYEQAGADELVFLDIAASLEGRETMTDVVRRTAQVISIPLAVGGGIGSLDQMDRILQAGAGKVSLNTAALAKPALIEDGARRFGSRCIVVAIDARWDEEKRDWLVYTHGGSKAAGLTAARWALQAEKLGAGEILLTSMKADGGQDGFDLPLNKAVAGAVKIPVIASGGAGSMEHFARVLTEGKADAALAASVFHYRSIDIRELKEYLLAQGIEVSI